MNSELPIEQTLRSMHRVFCEVTGDSPTYIGCERRLREFHNQGFAEDDIRLVVWFVNRENQKFSGAGYSKRFGKLFEQAQDGIFEHFSDLLGCARGARRAADHKAKHSFVPDKASILRATGRPDTKPLPDPQQAREVMEGLLKKGFEEALKEAEESKRVRL